MTENYFESLPERLRKAAEPQSPTPEEVERARLQQEFEALVTRRSREHIGDAPEAVWVPGVKSLCADFLQFAERRDFPKSERIHSTLNDGWSMLGYRLDAYIDPDRYTKTVTVESASANKPYPPEGYRAEPQPDVWLCIDGLIRKNGGEPLRMLNRSRRVETPVFGTWEVKYGHKDNTWEDGSGWPVRHYGHHEHRFTRTFIRIDPVQALRKHLSTLAMDIHRQEGTLKDQ